MHDVLIIGGGVVGLSTAWELAGAGMRVRVLERGPLGREASWAGAGILPAVGSRGDTPYEQLQCWSFRLQRVWAAQLREETGIDNGFRHCGEIYLACDDPTVTRLDADVRQWQRRDLGFKPIDAARLYEMEPATAECAWGASLKQAYYVADSCQLRNPRHLKALAAACRQRGVEIDEHCPVERFTLAGENVTAVETPQGPLSAESYCLTGGAWSGELLRPLGVDLPLVPIRGQIALLRTPRPVLRTMLMHGLQYLIPRDDGRLLVGSTLEEAGFDKRTTDSAIETLLKFASSLVPVLATAELESTWAGLRPGSPGGIPWIGRTPGADNLIVATGHFRWGLYLSPATAILVRQLLCDESPQIDLSEFRLDRPES